MKKIIFSLLLIIPVLTACGLESNSLTSGEFVEILKSNPETVLIDIRTPQEFNSGHLKGAVNIDFYEDGFKAALMEYSSDETILIYCRSGSRSGQTLKMMHQEGYENIFDLAGGIGSIGNLFPVEI